MKKNLLIFLGLAVAANLLSLALISAPAMADEEIGQLINGQLEPIKDIYGQDNVSEDMFGVAIAKIIKIVLGFLGIIFLALMVYAGYMWMTSAGNEEQISKAKKTMAAAIIGVAIVLASYIITTFVINQLLEATGAGEF